MKNIGYFVTGNESAVAGKAAALVIAKAWQAVTEKGRCTLVLSGGQSPGPLYRKLAEGLEPELIGSLEIPAETVPDADGLIRMPWKQTMIFWGDERCVPPEDPDSNYRLAQKTLLGAPGITEHHVFRIHSELQPASVAAESYEKTIRKALGYQGRYAPAEIPVFDIMVLGLGKDGHTASLFADDRKNLAEKHRLVVAVDPPKHARPAVQRISMTLPLINNAATVLFFTEGKYRAELAYRLMTGSAPEGLPAGMVKPASGNRYWFTVLSATPNSLQAPMNPEGRFQAFSRQKPPG